MCHEAKWKFYQCNHKRFLATSCKRNHNWVREQKPCDDAENQVTENRLKEKCILCLSKELLEIYVDHFEQQGKGLRAVLDNIKNIKGSGAADKISRQLNDILAVHDTKMAECRGIQNSIKEQELEKNRQERTQRERERQLNPFDELREKNKDALQIPEGIQRQQQLLDNFRNLEPKKDK